MYLWNVVCLEVAGCGGRVGWVLGGGASHAATEIIDRTDGQVFPYDCSVFFPKRSWHWLFPSRFVEQLGNAGDRLDMLNLIGQNLAFVRPPGACLSGQDFFCTGYGSRPSLARLFDEFQRRVTIV